ncbi:MAG: diphosphate--fructose-6-phosphate 1-phosphotransferase, partial [Balneolales bacterium]
MSASKKMAILVAGGPAPGINSVIGSVTIRAALAGVEVIGLRDGFKWIMQGDIEHINELTIDNVSRIHFRGGSFLGIARDNPTKNKQHLENVISSLIRLNVDKLITIGGDDTAFSAMTLEKAAAGRLRVVHVPKTIDNDLDLPHGIPTFGYQTARHIGVEIVKNLMVDATTTSRWYFAVAMGRKAGHLALGIGKAAGASMTLISEEFKGQYISIESMADVLVGAIIKRLSYGREDGVAVLAEGLVERLDPKELARIAEVELDEHDNLRIAEVDFGRIIKQEVQKRLSELGIKTTIVAKDIGYEVRCADPIPFDMEYTRDLGHSAAQFILDGGNAAMVSIQEGNFVPMYFKDILDKKTNKTRVRMVDVNSEYFKIARRYMLRLKRTDFEDEHELKKYSSIVGLSPEAFRKRFLPVIENDLLYQSSGVSINGLGVPQADG